MIKAAIRQREGREKFYAKRKKEKSKENKKTQEKKEKKSRSSQKEKPINIIFGLVGILPLFISLNRFGPHFLSLKNLNAFTTK